MINPDQLFGRMGNRLFQMAYIYSHCLDGKIPNVYLQDPAHFERHGKSIKEIFSNGIGFIKDTVSIHVRRGDYVDNPFYVDLSKTDYYQKAIAMFPGKDFMVFSDDPGFCGGLEIFSGRSFHIIRKGNELEDFNMMASCEHSIIANSSFSWWAAYLKQGDGIVIAPSVKNWHPDGVERTKCPAEWIRI